MAVDAASSPSSNGPKSISASGLAHVAGAAISLALLIGVTVWAYQLITRDVSGVPVVRAAEGPVRVQPETPGGAIADHQGLAVNDVAAVGTASRPADRLILAPAPLDLSQDDVVRTPVAETDAAEEPRETSQTEAADVPAETLDPVQLAAVEALANSLANGIDPIAAEDNTPDVAAAPVPEEEPNAELATAPATTPVEGGLGRSLRPKLRPAGLGGVPQAVTLTSAGPTEDIDPETLPVGTRLAQLGAFASADIAREEWEKLSAKFGDYLAGKSRVIQKATSGGRTFYRLRAAGFEDLSDARRFCSALVAERAECIPVVTR
ncbi:MAG: SPOR domain-containing protein [Pseudomonadota bacterium]